MLHTSKPELHTLPTGTEAGGLIHIGSNIATFYVSVRLAVHRYYGPLSIYSCYT